MALRPGAEAHRFSEELRSKYPGVGVPAQVWHYLHDADIRVKEPEYRLAQDDMLTDIIVGLERGEIPESACVNIALHPRWLGVRALLVVAILYWAFGLRCPTIRPIRRRKRRGLTQVLDSMARSLMAVRNISDAEAAVIERALEIAATDERGRELISLVRSLQIVSRCQCGCASVDFCVTEPDQVAEIVADAVGKSPSGEDLGLIVWTQGGKLSSLEVYSYSETPAPLPELASISSFGGAAG